MNAAANILRPGGWVYMGSKWGDSATLGTPGGPVLWSFADLDLSAELSRTYGDYPATVTPLSAREREDIRAVVAVWEAAGNIDLIEVPDSSHSGIRFGAAWLDGRGGTLAEATVWQDAGGIIGKATVIFDSGDLTSGNLAASGGFRSTAAHELGHAIGLDHSANPGALMYPYYNGLTALSPEDAGGAQAIYGAPSAAAAPLVFADLSATELDEVVKIVIALFNAAPGADFLPLMAEIAASASTAELARLLAQTPAFRSFLAGRDEVQAQTGILMDNLGLAAGTPGGNAAQAYFEARLGAGDSVGIIALDAVNFLSVTPDSSFAGAAALLANKTAIARHYSVSAPLHSADLDILRGVLAGVTEDAADISEIVASVSLMGIAEASPVLP
jgi:hypothetical protein